MDALMNRLRGIYSETTIDHILHPRNTEPIANPTGTSITGAATTKA